MSTIANAKKEARHDITMFKRYRNLLGELITKDVKLKYRNSWLGIFWSFLEPLLNMIVLSVVFNGIFNRNNAEVICYPVYLFTGRMVFDFFKQATKKAMMSFRTNQTIIKKVYVPKYMYPVSGVLSNFVTFSISLLCLVCIMVFFKVTGISNGHAIDITWRVCLFWVPIFICLILSIGVGLILSILQVYFRDIEYIFNVGMTLMFYMVPILYSLKTIQTEWMVVIIKLNPLYSIIELFRQCVLYGPRYSILSGYMIVYSLAFSVLVLFIGILIFNWKSDDIVYHL